MKRLLTCLLALGAALPPLWGAATPREGATKAAEMSYLRGMLLERRGAYAEALKAYEEALSQDPRSAYICREAADLALEIGQADKALQWARKVLELEPKSAESHVLMGRVEWARGDADEAEASFKQALKIDPRSAESIFSLGSLLSAKAPEKARELLSRFLDENPGQAAEAHFELAKLDLQETRYKDAEEHLKQAIALNSDSDSLPARYALAQAYEAEHSTDAALGQYLEISKIEPQNAALLNHIGQIYFLKGDWEQVRRRFEAAKTLQPDDPTANHWLALSAERGGDFAKAAGYLKASAALKDEPGLNLRLSYYLTQAGRLKEAVSLLEGAYARWPSNDQMAYFLALGYDDLKQDDKAIDLLRKVVGLKPEYRDARYQLAVLLERRNRMAEAEREFRALLAQKPDDASVLNYLGYSLADRGLKLSEAEELIQQAARLEPGNGAYQDSLGWVHFKQGKAAEAVKDLSKALETLPEDETVWDHLGDAYEAAGDHARAWLYWKRAESLYAAPSQSPRKSRRVESRFSAEELGGYYSRYLTQAQGGIEKLSGLCEVRGEVLGASFSFSGTFLFRSPEELEIDLLGPLFTPLFRLRLGHDGFSMDKIRVAGLDPEAARQAAAAALSAMREYLSGRLFALRPARYKPGWFKRSVEVPGWSLGLDRPGMLVQRITPVPESGLRLTLGGFGRTKGREVPRTLGVAGKGFTLSVQFNDVKIDFTPAPLP